MNPKDRIASKKVDLSLVPPASIIHEARAMANGAAKYGPYNWRQEDSGVNARVYVAAAMRHLASWLDGEEVASDSGVHHLAHAKACCGILLDAIECRKLNDDRPPGGFAAMMMEPLPPDDHETHLRAAREWKTLEQIKEMYPAVSAEHDAIAEALDAKAGGTAPHRWERPNYEAAGQVHCGCPRCR